MYSDGYFWLFPPPVCSMTRTAEHWWLLLDTTPQTYRGRGGGGRRGRGGGRRRGWGRTSAPWLSMRRMRIAPSNVGGKNKIYKKYYDKIELVFKFFVCINIYYLFLIYKHGYQ